MRYLRNPLKFVPVNNRSPKIYLQVHSMSITLSLKLLTHMFLLIAYSLK